MKLNTLLGAALILLLYSCGGNNSNSNNSQGEMPESKSIQPIAYENGQQLFEQKCAACHGDDGTAGISGATNLHLSTIDSAAIVQIISNGRSGMPSFNSLLTKTEVGDITNYIITLRK